MRSPILSTSGITVLEGNRFIQIAPGFCHGKSRSGHILKEFFDHGISFFSRCSYFTFCDKAFEA
jgi:hypothetical protein